MWMPRNCDKSYFSLLTASVFIIIILHDSGTTTIYSGRGLPVGWLFFVVVDTHTHTRWAESSGPMLLVLYSKEVVYIYKAFGYINPFRRCHCSTHCDDEDDDNNNIIPSTFSWTSVSGHFEFLLSIYGSHSMRVSLIYYVLYDLSAYCRLASTLEPLIL